MLHNRNKQMLEIKKALQPLRNQLELLPYKLKLNFELELSGDIGIEIEKELNNLRNLVYSIEGKLIQKIDRSNY